MTQMDMKFRMNAVNVGMSFGYFGFAVHLTVLASKCTVAKGAVPEVGICDVSFKVIHDC